MTSFQWHHHHYVTENVTMGVSSAGPCPPWIFIHGTDIVDRGLIVLFSIFFAIFRFLFAALFPENFSADALKRHQNNVTIFFQFALSPPIKISGYANGAYSRPTTSGPNEHEDKIYQAFWKIWKISNIGGPREVPQMTYLSVLYWLSVFKLVFSNAKKYEFFLAKLEQYPQMLIPPPRI